MYILNLPDFDARLEMIDTGVPISNDWVHSRHIRYDYKFFVNDELLITSYIGSPYYDNIFELLMSCLSGATLTPDSGVGDDYFEDYSPEAIAWRDSFECEQLDGLPYDYETDNDMPDYDIDVSNDGKVYTVRYK
jgi:hypothetical protein